MANTENKLRGTAAKGLEMFAENESEKMPTVWVFFMTRLLAASQPTVNYDMDSHDKSK